MSKLPFELLLALRYLRPRRTFVSVITLISVVGVALGVAVLIIVISVMSGFGHDLRERILGFNAPIQISTYDRPMDNYEQVMRVVSSNQNVIGVAPFVLGPVLLKTEPTNGDSPAFATPYIRGVDINTEASVSDLGKKILPGGSFDLSGQGLVVGSTFAEDNGLSVGDHVSIYSPDEIKKMAAQLQNGKTNGEAFLPNDYTITGVFDVGWDEYNAHIIAMSLENAQDLYDLDDSVHGLFVKLVDPYQAAVVKTQLEDTLGDQFRITTWEEQNGALLGAVLVEKNVMRVILFFIVIVAALCMLSAQITFVIRKTKEIGILKAVGSTNFQISIVFLAQSAIIGIIGVLSGLGLGILALTYRNEVLHLLNRWTGFELFPASIYGFSELPAIIAPNDVAIISIISFVLICLVGGLLPAILAYLLKPVEALRYE
jgi:lipoprotein-releasing system permease protein